MLKNDLTKVIGMTENTTKLGSKVINSIAKYHDNKISDKCHEKREKLSLLCTNPMII